MTHSTQKRRTRKPWEKCYKNWAGGAAPTLHLDAEAKGEDNGGGDGDVVDEDGGSNAEDELGREVGFDEGLSAKY